VDYVVAPVKRIDQIYCRMENVGDVNKLYYLFANTFGFPEAWPPTPKKYYYGGGVYTGNTWLKWITFNTKAYKMTDKPAKFSILSAEPNGYERCLKEFEKRGIRFKFDGIQTIADSSGLEQEWVRSSSLTESPFKEVDLSIGKYTSLAFPALTTTPEARDLDEHYSIMSKRLDAVDGGPLGVRYVKEVELGVKDEKGRIAWQTLLSPIKQVGNVWKVGKGPVLRLTPDKENSIKSISFKVMSLRRAKKFLKMNGLLGEEKENMASLNRSKINDLDIRFVK
jgi:hypothetical protein